MPAGSASSGTYDLTIEASEFSKGYNYEGYKRSIPGERSESVDLQDLDLDSATIASNMMARLEDEDVQCTGAQMLGKSARGSLTQRLAVLTADGPKLIAAAMAQHGRSAKVQIAGCEALANIATGNHDCRKALLEHGGLEALMTAMEQHSGNVRVLQSGCDAVRSLVSGEQGNNRKWLLKPWGHLGSRWAFAPSPPAVHVDATLAAALLHQLEFTPDEWVAVCRAVDDAGGLRMTELRHTHCVRPEAPGEPRYLRLVPPIDADGNPLDEPLGLAWEEIGSQAPAGGREVVNAALAAALQRNVAFTPKELAGFELSEALRPGDYVQSTHPSTPVFFKPARDVPLGLKWLKVDSPAQPVGAELVSTWLSCALQQQDAFSADELHAVGSVDIDHSHYVRTWLVGDVQYFQPAAHGPLVRWKQVDLTGLAHAVRARSGSSQAQPFHTGLSAALQRRTVFSDAEMRAFGLSRLRPDHVVASILTGATRYKWPVSLLGLVVHAMERYASDEAMQLKGASLLGDIALGEEIYKQALIDAGGLMALLECTRRSEDNAVRRAGCRALAHLAHGSESTRYRLRAAGAIQVIADAMRAQLGDATLQSMACGALSRLAHALASTMAEHGSRWYSTHANDPELRDAASHCVSSDVAAAPLKAVIHAGGPEAVVAAMGHPYESERQRLEVLRAGCAALKVFAMSENEAVSKMGKDAVVRAGGVQAVAAAMKAGHHDPVIRGRASGTLGCLAFGDSNLQQAVASAAGKTWYSDSMLPDLK